MDDIPWFILRLLESILIVLVLIPVVWILATPFILIGAAFVKQPYLSVVGKAYWKTAAVLARRL